MKQEPGSLIGPGNFGSPGAAPSGLVELGKDVGKRDDAILGGKTTSNARVVHTPTRAAACSP